MEPFFENHIKMTGKLLEEFVRETYRVVNKKLRTISLIMFIIYLFFAMFTFVFAGFSFSTYVFSLLFLSAIFSFIFYKGYLFKLRENQKNLEALHGELPDTTIKFYEDNFENITNRSSVTIEYSRITEVLETENLFIIMIEKQGVILLKQGFVIGEFYDFKTFIENKINTK